MKVYCVEVERIEDDGAVFITSHYVLGDSIQSVANAAQLDLIDGFENHELKSVRYVITVTNDYRAEQ